MALTDIKIKRATPKIKDFWLTDEKGLRLLIKKNGAKYWRLKYRFGGKQKTLAIGVYPETSLKMARDARTEARQQLKEGIDPSQAKKEKMYSMIMNDTNTFSKIALDWWNHEKVTWTQDHANRLLHRLEKNAFKYLDNKPMDKILTRDILIVIKNIEKRGALDIAGRVLQDIRRVFTYAVRRDLLKFNPALDLTGVVKLKKRQHQPSMQNEELGQFMSELEEYSNRGYILTQYALQLLIFTFTRSGEIRGATWDEFDFKKSIWKIPAERMKMGTEHLVPLSKQALSVLVKVQEISGIEKLLFPMKSNRNKPMSDNTMRCAMRRMGYDGEHESKSKATPHGFRANASSILNEKGFNPDAIERQLSHMERNSVRAAYIHHARYKEERTEMMQWWADYLDKANFNHK
jgi:integrase